VRAAAEAGSTANSYQILAKLATGGMAEIFLARGEGVAGVERHCVLKRILRDRASDANFVRMFLDEARLAAQLQHPNIAQVYDIGKLGDSYFFTMEYVHGETVRALLHRAQGLRRTLPINCVLTIAAGTAAGLHHAHDRLGLDGRPLGIVHRDVSPSNLMVSYEGGVKVVDFGVAKAEDRAQETKSGTVKGKISYLSPEQCKGKRVDRRSDLFSLGICFWEMLTTERLYKRSSDFENMNAIVTEATPPPSSRRPDVPREVDALVLRLLAKSADDRFQTADELVDAIEVVAARTGSVLSSSALGRFARELFGQRPEPWLEVEARHEPGAPVTVTSEPIPDELAAAVVAEVDAQLSSVLDLSAPRVATESLQSLEALGGRGVDQPTARHTRLALGLPIGSATPRSPVPPARASTAVEPGPVGGAGVARVVEAAAPRPPAPPARPSIAPGPAGMARAAAPRPPLLPTAIAAGPLAMRALAAASASPPRPPEQVGSPAPPPRPTGSGPWPAPSGAFAAPSGTQAALGTPGAPGASGAPARGRMWPWYAAVGSAALLGSIAVVLAVRSGGASLAAVPATRDRTATLTERARIAPASTITVVPIPESEASGTTETGETGSVQTIGVPAAGADAKRPGDAPVATPSKRAPPRSVEPTPAPGASRGVEPAGATRPPVRRESPDDEITRAFTDARYDRVVALCSAGPISGERAPFCFMAACHLKDEAKARKLIAAVPAASRERFIGTCQQLGIDVSVRTSNRPAVDCDADPMACQR